MCRKWAISLTAFGVAATLGLWGMLHAATGGATVKATFAGGCFWCMEEVFEGVGGVVSVTSGYTGGHAANPGYKDVSAGNTGHVEAIEVLYDPAKVTYEQLLDVFWRNVDPLTPDRQFCDIGTPYRSAVYYHDDAQKRAAESAKAAIERSKRFREPIVTPIVAASRFYPAEEYHQDFYKKNPFRYKAYKFNCGRAQRLSDLWGKS